jgi:hypothetical protein
MDELHQFYFWVLLAAKLAFDDTMQPNIELILTAGNANRRKNRGTAQISCQRNIDSSSRIHLNSIVLKIIMGRTPASSEPCFGSKLASEISLNSNTCLSFSRSSFANYCWIKSFRAVIFVAKFSWLSPAIVTRKLQFLFSGFRLHLIAFVTFFSDKS